jgi:glycine betaine/proline transport system substrate-binding protein
MKMKIKALLLSAGMVLAGVSNANQCDTVRFADVGWTDITATTALTSVVLESIGYKTKTQVLSVPITYKALCLQWKLTLSLTLTMVQSKVLRKI